MLKLNMCIYIYTPTCMLELNVCIYMYNTHVHVLVHAIHGYCTLCLKKIRVLCTHVCTSAVHVHVDSRHAL